MDLYVVMYVCVCVCGKGGGFREDKNTKDPDRMVVC